MKKFVLLLGLLLVCNQVFALDVVYPKSQSVIVDAKSSFFIGSTNSDWLKINGQSVKIHPSGGFAYVVNLLDGENKFVIESGPDKQVFFIIKPVRAAACYSPVKLVEFTENKSFYVINENSSLRSTPIDNGVNRIAHLPCDTELIIDAEQGNFYRVVLGQNKKAWIAKLNVKENCTNSLAELKGYDYIDSEDYFTFVFHLNKKVPFEIVEESPMLMKFYNVKNQPDNTYVMDFPVQEAMFGKKLLGYSGEYQGNDFIWRVRKPILTNEKQSLKNITIAVDAGHGGNEIGAIGCLRNNEKDINLQIAKFLETELKRRGANVVMTRNNDIYLGLQERVDIANRENSVVLLSIHGNALPDGADPNKNSGTSIYYYYNQAKPLADVLINTMTSDLGLNNDKVRQASLALIRNTNALSLLIEVGYLINPDDNSKLIDRDFQKKVAKSIADGLEKYFRQP